MIKTQNVLSFLLRIAVGTFPSMAGAATENHGSINDKSSLLEKLRDEVVRGFAARINLQGFGVVQQPVDSRLNPNNALEIPRYQAELELRPDLNLDFRRLELSVKPRFTLRWRQWEDGVRQGDSETDTELFVNEWLARYRVTNQLFVSYGRENLQWGPSYLLSPSNPFNPNNGQNTPRLEVPGLDYGRVVWIPGYAWSISFIANLNEGRLDLLRDFHRTYALKLDYTGEGKYFSLIPSYREDDEFRLGFFAGWTVSDALLLHIEGSLSDTIDDSEILVGGSYTLARGPTIVVEFFHNGNGCTLGRIDLCFAPGLGNADPADILIRQNYLLVQYVHTRIRDIMNLSIRWIRNLDDDSNRIIGVFNYEISAHVQLFVIGNIGVGDEDTEFGSLLDYSVTAGASYTF
jgi:hypothetical protein